MNRFVAPTITIIAAVGLSILSQSGALAKSLKENLLKYSEVKACHEGKMLAAVALDTTPIEIYDLRFGKQIYRILRGHIEPTLTMHFSEDGGKLASSSVDNVKIWDIATGKVLKTLNLKNVRYLCFVDSDKYLRTCSINGRVADWSVSDGSLKKEYSPDNQSSLAIAGDDNLSTLAILDTKTDILSVTDSLSGKHLFKMNAPLLEAAALNSSGDLVGMVTLMDKAENNFNSRRRVQVFQLKTSSSILDETTRNECERLFFSPNSDQICYKASTDGKTWDISCPHQPNSIQAQEPQYGLPAVFERTSGFEKARESMKFFGAYVTNCTSTLFASHDDRFLGILGGPYTILLDVEGSKPRYFPMGQESFGGKYACVNRVNGSLALFESKTITTWDLSNFTRKTDVRVTQNQDYFDSFDFFNFDPSSDSLVLTKFVSDYDTGERTKVVEAKGSSVKTYFIKSKNASSPNSDNWRRRPALAKVSGDSVLLVATGCDSDYSSYDNEDSTEKVLGIEIQDLRSADTRQVKFESPVTIQNSFKRRAVTPCALSDGGNRFAIGSTEGTIFIIDTANGEQVEKLSGHAGSVLALEFSRDSKRLCSTGKDKSVRIWNLEDGSEELCSRDNLTAVYSTICLRELNTVFGISCYGELKSWNIKDKTVKDWSWILER
ncbi:MAG: hypothetical protein KC777_28065 [Cyanobacteria bacterium HKST-UBA02]|nr:hypothetical protein [Cyanobacteria bacterium HKST-UBA02]